MKKKALTEYLDSIHLVGTILIAISLPFSPFTLSVSQFLVIANWLVRIFTSPLRGESYLAVPKMILQRRSVLFIIGIFLVHVLWLINTTNFQYALHDLKIKLPVLALPIIYGTSPGFNKRNVQLVLRFFIAAILVASLMSLAVSLGLTPRDPQDQRHISLFISHIRFALLIDLSIFILIYFIIYEKRNNKLWLRALYIILVVWLSLFLILLNSLTGVIILFIGLPLTVLYKVLQVKSKKTKLILLSIASLILIAIGSYFRSTFIRFKIREKVVFEELEQYTANGNKYQHYPDMSSYENEHRVWTYTCDKELRNEWNKISDYKYDLVDRKGQLIRYTIVRYMASLGLRKDSTGISRLTPEDIEMIEKGNTNYLLKNKFALYPRLYSVFWEIEAYQKTGNPNGHSITQRIEFIRTGLNLAKNNFWFGVGTGDVEDACQQQYEEDQSSLSENYRFRSHNQYLTFFIAFGVFGFLYILIALFYPVCYERKHADFLFTMFYFIALMSMINEDTLETQAGVTFFAFFLSLLLLGRRIKSESE